MTTPGAEQNQRECCTRTALLRPEPASHDTNVERPARGLNQAVESPDTREEVDVMDAPNTS
jgi:hypothetical protein